MISWSQKVAPCPKTPVIVNLQAIQEEIKCNLQIDLTALVKKAIEPVQANINASMTKLNTQYDDLSHTVQMMQQEITQQKGNSCFDKLMSTVKLMQQLFQHIFSQLQTILPSLSLLGGGSA